MSQTLEQIARQLRATEAKAQLTYAFNSIGHSKTAHGFMVRVATGLTCRKDAGPAQRKFLCCNILTEDPPREISQHKKQFEDRGNCPLSIRRAV